MCYKIFISLRKRNIPVRARRHRLLAMRLALTRLRSLREALPRMFLFLIYLLLSFFLIPRQQPLDLYQFLQKRL